MAPATDVAPHCNPLGDNRCKGCVSEREEDDQINEELESSSHAKADKPPRNVIVMRHCISQATLVSIYGLELTTEIINLKSSNSVENSEFVPVFHSGSCSEIGPKPFMEDEYFCVDNLSQHIGTGPTIPSPGAFYGKDGEMGGWTDADWVLMS